MSETNDDLRKALKEIGQEIVKLLERAGGMARETAGDMTRWAGNAVGHDSGGGSALDQIERLGTLRDKGFVTEEEFQAKKAELLKKIA
jgi:hypothetical protein